jgi:hypothetical protein
MRQYDCRVSLARDYFIQANSQREANEKAYAAFRAEVKFEGKLGTMLSCAIRWVKKGVK